MLRQRVEGGRDAGAAFAAVLYTWLQLRARATLPADTTARLAELQSRIRPHFLFNTLNTAIALARLDPARTEHLLEDLAELFRVALSATDESVSLAEEVALAQRYLAIEQIRFGDRLRVEHWANALNGGPAAARAMLGRQVTYDRVPYFFSDQYDLGMEYSGWAPPGTYDEVVIRGDAGKREFVAFWVKQGRVLAGMNVNVWDVTEPIQGLIRSGAQVDTEALADPHVPLVSLVP